MTSCLANYEQERQAFLSLLEPDCTRRIVLFSGESGSGKTALLTYCQMHVQPTVTQLPVQLRGTTVSVAEIFYRFGALLGWEHLSTFTRGVEQLSASPTITIDRNWTVGYKNQISVALHAENPTDRDERRAVLTNAWFEDVGALQRKILIVFDTFEQATTEVKDWISGPFLARAPGVMQMRVVVAGQEVPSSNNIEWGSCCCTHCLFGVIDAIHWMPVVEAMGKRIPVSPPETYLAGICHALKGRPDAIIKVIESFPSREAQS